MSIADDLAALIATGTDNAALFTAVLEKLAEIEANAVAHTLWVDPQLGDNSNDGRVPAAAKQTIGAAGAATPVGSYCRVNLLGDYTMEANIQTGGRIIRTVGVDAAGVPAQRLFNQTVAAGEARRLICGNGGAFFLANLDLMLTKTAITFGPTALVSGRLKTLFLLDCGVDVEDGATSVSVMGADGVATLEVDTVTALGDALAGHWISGVSAGTDPATRGEIITNLATL